MNDTDFSNIVDGMVMVIVVDVVVVGGAAAAADCDHSIEQYSTW